MSNQCEHGQLARVCERCEDKAEIERLRASERSAWNAAVMRDEEIERLRLTLTIVRPYVYGLDNIKRIDAALSGAQAEQPAKQPAFTLRAFQSAQPVVTVHAPFTVQHAITELMKACQP